MTDSVETSSSAVEAWDDMELYLQILQRHGYLAVEPTNPGAPLVFRNKAGQQLWVQIDGGRVRQVVSTDHGALRQLTHEHARALLSAFLARLAAARGWTVSRIR